MKVQNVNLMPAEYDALLEIIRRDLRSQTTRISAGSMGGDWYESNHRMCTRLLELLNPKRRTLHQALYEVQKSSE
jgi:hypothetical protein